MEYKNSYLLRHLYAVVCDGAAKSIEYYGGVLTEVYIIIFFEIWSGYRPFVAYFLLTLNQCFNLILRTLVLNLTCLFRFERSLSRSCTHAGSVWADWSPLQAYLMQNYAKAHRPSKLGEAVAVVAGVQIKQLPLVSREIRRSFRCENGKRAIRYFSQRTPFHLNWNNIWVYKSLQRFLFC
jgi:hypothetical protein